MKKLFLAVLMFLLISLPAVAAVSTEITYDYTAYNGQGYNLVTGRFEEKGYWASTNKMLINPAADPATISIETAGYFHHILFFNDKNQYIGYKNCSTTTNYDTGGDEYLGLVSCASSPATVSYPENARSFALQVYQWREYLDDIILTGTASYMDVFGDDIFDTTYSENLIPNGSGEGGGDMLDMQERATSTDYGYNSTYSLKTSYEWTNRYAVSAGNVYYFATFIYQPVGNTSAPRVYTDLSNILSIDEGVWTSFSDHWTESGGGVRYLMSSDPADYIYYDDIMLFNLTDIYGATNEPDLTTFEAVIADWQDEMDGLNEEYYSSALNWLAIDLSDRITYEYDYVAQTYNVNNGINNLLTNIGINTAVEKTFLGVAFLVALVILVAMVSRSKPAIIVAAVVGYLAFTILGWFPVWIAILIALILLVLAIITFNSNGGGTNE